MQRNEPAIARWHCKPCHQLYYSWEALMKHKSQKRSENKGDHIHCKFCGQDFVTEVAEIRHIQEAHPQEQDLDCPGCGHGPFKRLGGLMSHIESGECVRIDTSVLEELREKKLEFPRRLEELTKQSVKGNYMRYMPAPGSTKSIKGWETTKEPAAPFNGKAEDFPTLSSTAGGRVRASESAISTASKTEDDMGAWGTDEMLSRVPLAQCSLNPLQAATTPGVTTVLAGTDPDDPDSPAFRVARYYCQFTEKFNCPKAFCGKNFKKAGGLVAHLRSPAHGDKTYRCPYCLKIFKSLTAITQHAESSSNRCRIRDTDNYDSFLDQLTAGIVDVDRTRHDDGTVKYKTSEQAKQRFRGKDVDENAGPI